MTSSSVYNDGILLSSINSHDLAFSSVNLQPNQSIRNTGTKSAKMLFNNFPKQKRTE